MGAVYVGEGVGSQPGRDETALLSQIPKWLLKM